VPDFPLFPVVPVADSFLRAKEKLFPADDELKLDRRVLATRCAQDLRVETPEQWQEALDAIRASLGDAPDVLKWFEATHAQEPFRPGSPLNLRPEKLGYDGHFLHLSADAFGVADVYGAAELCDHILNYRNALVDYDLKDQSSGSASLAEGRGAVGSLPGGPRPAPALRQRATQGGQGDQLAGFPGGTRSVPVLPAPER
jgi:hypothetical protein